MKSVQSNLASLGVAILALTAGTVMAQPSLVSLGGSSPLSVTNELSGTYYVGGVGTTGTATRWSLTGTALSATNTGGSGSGYISRDGLYLAGLLPNTGGLVRGNTAAGVTPPYNPNPTLVPSTTLPADTEFGGQRWSSASMTWQGMGGLPIVPDLIAYGSSSSGQPTSSFLTPNGISATGRFSVGLGYVCTYNTAGTTVSANSFRWRPWIWDADGNGGAGEMIILPTPFRTTSGQTSLRRTGNAYAVSADGLVVAGAQEHNSSVSPSADPDGSRFVVWRRASLSDPFVMSFLDTGVDGSGFPKIGGSSTPSSLAMNAAGTIIAARGPDGITKWVWDGSSWGAPNVLGNNLTTPATWLPAAVTSCGVPPNIGGILAMTDDGNTIVGSAVYSTCGSFMTGGFIWTNDDGIIQDWYDYNNALGTPGCTPGGFYGPTGDNGDPTKGLPVLGNPLGISADGTAIVGNQGGTQRIVGAPGWVWRPTGAGDCAAPAIASDPAATTNFSACTNSIILNVSATGTAPFTYQWYKDGQPLFDGLQPSGSNVTGATGFQLRVNPPLTPSDTGTYYAVVTGQCGSPAQTTDAVVQLDPQFPAATNDTCGSAEVVTMGNNVLGAGQSPCGAYIDDMDNSITCLPAFPKTDRWFVFTPTATADYRLETCGSNYDTVLSVFNACGGVELACNDNLNIGPTTGCSSNRSRIGSLPMTADTAYYIRIAAPATAFLSSTNLMNLSITLAPPPVANDTCFTPTVAVQGANPFDTTEATNDFTASCNTALSRDVWFTYTPGGNGVIRAATCPGTTWNTVLSILDSCQGNELACNDNASITGCSQQSIISGFRANGGVTYYFRIGGSSPTTFGVGTFTLEFQCYADFNNDGGVDGGDVEAFFSLWETGQSGADVNNDGGVDGGDVETFFALWEAGGCG